MAHKTLIGGTAYEISGGKTLVGGTAYGIKNGKTLVGGTGYDVSFAPKLPTVTIIDNGETTHNISVTIDGQTYGRGTNTVLSVMIGTKIECSITSDSFFKAYIKVNGGTVATATTGNKTVTYTYELKGDITIQFTKGAGAELRIDET